MNITRNEHIQLRAENQRLVVSNNKLVALVKEFETKQSYHISELTRYPVKTSEMEEEIRSMRQYIAVKNREEIEWQKRIREKDIQIARLTPEINVWKSRFQTSELELNEI